MSLELNRLDLVGESLLQVTNIERTRAVSVAQQETVAMAQILKVGHSWFADLTQIVILNCIARVMLNKLYLQH